MLVLVGLAGEAAAESLATADMRQASAFLAAGRFSQATALLEIAVAERTEAADEDGRLDALLMLGAAQQGLGAYTEALRTLEAALASARIRDDGIRTTLALASLGDVRLATGPLVEAETLLYEAVARARVAEEPGLLARVLLALGNLRSLQERPGNALTVYVEAAAAATLSEQVDARARALVSAVRAALDADAVAYALGIAGEAAAAVAAIPPSYDRVTLQIHLARSLESLAGLRPEELPPLLSRAVELLEDAERSATRIGDSRSASYAAGFMGGIYESAARDEEALVLSRRAAALATLASANESLYLWQWQSGRILTRQGRRAEAIGAYEQALASLAAIRFDLPVRYGEHGSAFRETVEPVYDGLVDLLLQEASAVSDAAASEAWLRRARSTLESLRAAELRDYFRDECVDAQRERVRSVDETSLSALIVYPVLLPDRVELLLTLPGGRLTHRTVAITGAEVRDDLHMLRRLLTKRTSRQYLRPARRLYDVLVRPYESLLADAEIETIVFVPDGPLLMVPPGVFDDGEHPLVERYAVAVTPGLELMEPTPFSRKGSRHLLAGLSESVQGFSALPQVKREIDGMHAAYGGTVLLDRDFRVAQLRETVVEGDFSLVHIATHAELRPVAEESFLLAWDGRISLNRLEEYVGRFRYRDRPLELLTLSACQTAEGSERAALGLSGVAVKAGARSVLGTLWSVQDDASAMLVLEFYRQLISEGEPRAEALRRAQLLLLSDSRFTHPAYWSAFLLIGSWL